MSDAKTIDKQQVELLGRGILVEQLVRDGLEVALPIRDRGVDIVAYTDLAGDVQRFVSRPIQMKAASTASFSLDRKYAKIADLLIAYVWQVDSPDAHHVYAMSYADAVGIGDQMGYTKTPSWAQGKYTTTRPSKVLRTLLEPFQIRPGRWRSLVLGESPA